MRHENGRDEKVVSMNRDDPYTRGMHEVGDKCFAYLQPAGGWGWSNAGLVVGDGASLIIDTLFDLNLTRAMLAAMSDLTDRAPVGSLVNTHANGDHCYGNSEVVALWPEVEIVASTAAAAEMPEVPPSMLAALNEAPGDLGDLFRSFFGEFDFSDIDLALPTKTFDGGIELDVGGRVVQLMEVGPAHTAGDVIAYVPDSATVYTGDILFIGGTPIVWAGPLSNWVAACDLMLDLEVAHVVPGHGPLTDRSGIIGVRHYLSFVESEALGRHAAGLDAFDAARDIALSLRADERFSELGEFGRIAVNVDTVYRNVDDAHITPDVVEQFRRMAELEAS